MTVRIIAAICLTSAMLFLGCGRSAPTSVETRAPAVLSTQPAPGASNVSTAGQIKVVFSEKVDPTSVVLLVDGLPRGTFTVEDSVVTLTLANRLFPKVPHLAVVPAGVRDLAGNTMPADFAWSFTTGFAPLGEEWSVQDASTTSDLHALVQGADQILAVGDAGAILLSDDGYVWNVQNSSSTSDLRTAFPIGDRWLAAGSPATLLASQGINSWLADELSGTAATITDMWVGQDGIYMVGASSEDPHKGVVIRYLATGNYTSAKLESPYLPRSICRFKDGWIVVGDSGMVFGSADGISWTDQSQNPSVGNLSKVRWDAFTGALIAVGGSIFTSVDGKAWKTRDANRGVQLHDIAFTNLEVSGVRYMLYCVVGDNGTILTSENLALWTPRSSGVASDLYAVASGGVPARFVAVGEGGTVLLSQ